MSFVYASFLIPVLITLVLFIYFVNRVEKSYFQWVKDHWFFKRSYLNHFASVSYFIGFTFILLGLLDLRGPEERIQGKTLDQKTIILLDSSASMLAEDVRPNRFSKSIMLVKHYVKKAVGQQISLVVFSDNQKRIVPFTDDMNLIKARLNRLETMNLNRGGTGLSQAIQESIEYFKYNSGEKVGNILIFTDAEETEFGFDIDIPDSITVGIVGVGTRQGAVIPIRNTQGQYLGNKKHDGKEVTTKLDEDFLKKLGTKIKNFKYWIATSYSIPTEDILTFFSKINKVKESQNEFRVRPILGNYLLVPGVIFLLLSFLLKNFKTFVPAMLVVMTLSSAYAKGEAEEKKPEKTLETLKLEELFSKNKLPLKGRKALAFRLLKDGFPDQSEVLYEEILSEKISIDNLNDHFNLALAKIKNKKKHAGVKKYSELLSFLESSSGKEVDEYSLHVKKNVLLALSNQGGGKGKSDNKDKKDKSEKGDNSDDKNKSNKSDDKNKKQDESKDQKDQEQKDKKSEPKEEEKNKDEQKNKQNEKQKNQKKKTPAILKQLISDDNKLQKKLIDAKTTERKSSNKKDW